MLIKGDQCVVSNYKLTVRVSHPKLDLMADSGYLKLALKLLHL